MYRFLKYNKEPDFIASRKPFVVDGNKTGWVKEEWYTKDIAIPDWWNEECHVMVEKKMVAGKGLVKFCLKCNKQIPESGCKHNLNK